MARRGELDRTDWGGSPYTATHGFCGGAVGVLAGAEAIAINFFESPDAFGLILGLASAVVLLYLSVRLSEMVLPYTVRCVAPRP